MLETCRVIIQARSSCHLHHRLNTVRGCQTPRSSGLLSFSKHARQLWPRKSQHWETICIRGGFLCVWAVWHLNDGGGGGHSDPSDSSWQAASLKSRINLHFASAATISWRKRKKLLDMLAPDAHGMFMEIINIIMWKNKHKSVITLHVHRVTCSFTWCRCTWPPFHISSVSPWELPRLCRTRSKPAS